LCACTSMLSEDRSLSAWSLFFTIVMMTESSILPVGAPAPISRVRTIVVLWSRSDWRSVGAKRHWVIFELTSVEAMPAAPLLVVALTEFVAPVVEVLVALWSLLATAPVELVLALIELAPVEVLLLLAMPLVAESVELSDAVALVEGDDADVLLLAAL